MRVLLTGASGFVGKAVMERICSATGFELIVPLRNPSTRLPEGVAFYIFSDFADLTAWPLDRPQVDTVIHCASRVHVMNETAADPLDEFRKVNVHSTLAFARKAAQEGVKRFIFISSIKVNGEGTVEGYPYHADDQPAPADPYGVSKLEAEVQLRQLGLETGMEIVIIRPVLVYGPGVKANFLNMMRWLDKGVPLPFGSIANKRSLVAIENLVDLIVTCCTHPGAVNQTFLVSDGVDVSTTELLRMMGDALGRPARLLPVPSSLLKVAASALGKRSLSRRLCGSLQVNISDTQSRLGWKPPVSLEQALRATARYYLDNKNK